MARIPSILARRLAPGDRIGVVSPSGVVTPSLRSQLDCGVAFLEGLGFDVVLGRHALSASLGYSATPEEKAADLNEMFCDPAVGAILCSQGGATANACLPLLDYDAIRANPKILLGISDITVLLNAIQSQTGLVTFHGDDVMWGFGRQVREYGRQAFLARLVEGRIGPIPAAGDRSALESGTARGPLLGGNITSLLKLAGTPYFPAFDGAILFLEEFGFSPERVYCQMKQLEQIGVMDRIAGIVVGFIYDEAASTGALCFEEVVRTVVGGRRIPVLKVNDFGHNCPNTVLPVGGIVRMDAARGELEIVEPCVGER